MSVCIGRWRNLLQAPARIRNSPSLSIFLELSSCSKLFHWKRNSWILDRPFQTSAVFTRQFQCAKLVWVFLVWQAGHWLPWSFISLYLGVWSAKHCVCPQLVESCQLWRLSLAQAPTSWSFELHCGRSKLLFATTLPILKPQQRFESCYKVQFRPF